LAAGVTIIAAKNAKNLDNAHQRVGVAQQIVDIDLAGAQELVDKAATKSPSVPGAMPSHSSAMAE
jgi:hypothetical protein